MDRHALRAREDGTSRVFARSVITGNRPALYRCKGVGRGSRPEIGGPLATLECLAIPGQLGIAARREEAFTENGQQFARRNLQELLELVGCATRFRLPGQHPRIRIKASLILCTRCCRPVIDVAHGRNGRQLIGERLKLGAQSH